MGLSGAEIFGFESDLRGDFDLNSLNPTQVELRNILKRFKERVDGVLSNGLVLLPFDPSGKSCKMIRSFDQNNPAFELTQFLKHGRDVESSLYGTEMDILHSKESISCLVDFVRTYKFIEALFLHLDRLEAILPGKIEVVDAGSGGIPVFGLLAAIKSDRTVVTCIENNPTSVISSREVIQSFGLQDRIKVINADATTYEHDKLIDLLISETMHVALLGNEPLVKILNNLCRFVSEHGVIIPEGVNVELALAREEELQRLRRVVDITGLSTYAYLDFEKIARFNPMA